MARDKLTDIYDELHPKPRAPTIGRPTLLSDINKYSKVFHSAFSWHAFTQTPTLAPVIKMDKLFRVPAGKQTMTLAQAHAQAQAQVPAQAPVQDTGIANDMHNVHDHAVMATLKSSYDKLTSETKMVVPRNQCLKELKQFARSYLKNDQQQDAMIALDAVERNIIPHTGIGATESDALVVVWNRINDKFGSDTASQRTIKENLANGLAEMVEHGKVCCTTGRLSRILDSLNIIDDAVQIKPTFAINQEMMDKASAISADKLAHANEKVRDDYNNAKDTKEVINLQKNIKQKIRSELEQDYVKSGVLTQDGFNAQVDAWINDI